MEKLGSLEARGRNRHPIIVILGIASESESGYTEAPNKSLTSSASLSLHGLSLLEHISSGISDLETSRNVILVTMIYNTDADTPLSPSPAVPINRSSPGGIPNLVGYRTSSPKRPVNKRAILVSQQMRQSIDAGAQDILTSPLQEDRLQSLKIHKNKVRKGISRERSQYLASSSLGTPSWLGNSEKKPYAYLREQM